MKNSNTYGEQIFREFQEGLWTPIAGFTVPSLFPPDGLASRFVVHTLHTHNQYKMHISFFNIIPICVQGSEVAHPGVAPDDPEDRTEHVYHKYYQVTIHSLVHSSDIVPAAVGVLCARLSSRPVLRAEVPLEIHWGRQNADAGISKFVNKNKNLN